MSWIHISLLFVVSAAVSAPLLSGQDFSFSAKLYPVLEQAGCRNCHNVEGVASATRLHFPEKDASKARVEAFGKSLVEFVDGQNPDASLLLLKPTKRIPHTGGERIPKGGPEEAAVKSWIGHLAKLSGAEVKDALRYRREEEAGYGIAPAVVLRRLTHSQYDNTIRDLLKDASNPASQFPTEDYVNGFKNQYQDLSVSPILAEAYSRAAEILAANAFRRGDSRGLIPCKPASDAGCSTKFIRVFGRRAFRRPLEPEEVALYQDILKPERTFSRARRASSRPCYSRPASFSGSMKRRIQDGSPMHRLLAWRISFGTPRPTILCWTARLEAH